MLYPKIPHNHGDENLESYTAPILLSYCVYVICTFLTTNSNISLNSINRLFFIIETQSVIYEVGAKILNIIT
jgi:hypothetical protein